MARPASKPRWADVGGDIVVPSSGKQDVGWAAEERPPNSYMNWLHNLTYDWIAYLAAQAGEERTRIMSPAEFLGESGALFSGTYWQSSAGGDTYVNIPLTFHEDVVINEIKIHVLEPDNAAEYINAAPNKYVPSTNSLTAITANKNSGATGAYATILFTSADTGIPYTLVAGTVAYVRVLLQQTTTLGESQLRGAEIKYEVL